ncbi:DNA-directed RNA polymerase, RBP11-like dimerization domain [Pseudocohnilembus persalinus]|uniref:DNA-directed RNA polymerase, RBP11-like dimerization domain n=1 Tax=Pseudocohnilembus persalinus TaxID=266149 RepID=A0A0V0R009_PSEPJ|nr:DNA-directed RNA polymerase, RBP11-like dimerization domain [Pseudocohnilembus persalinus]|eukprot:KRX07803.1 DNA-directed RNA polymerase, RBP11-like dimerization domain [Pseudocohnilembus persalinus]
MDKKSFKEKSKKMKFTNDGVQNNTDVLYAGAYLSSNEIQQFNENIDISIHRLDEKLGEMELDIKGIEAPIANALRRVMIAEIPTMAIHKVSMFQNTSIIPDEVLCHRLGLIPIKADAFQFNEKRDEEENNENNSIQFSLNIRCQRKKQYQNKKDSELEGLNPEDYLENSVVYSSDLKWVPLGKQQEKFQEIKPVHEKIIIAKLRENQEICCDLICLKGIGRTHAKWSPVSTAFYRLMNDIQITKPIKGEKAKELKKLCPQNVFDVEGGKAVVKNPRDCTVCRECIRLDQEFNEKIELGKDKEHYIFTIESVGIYTPEEIFKQALQMIKKKALSYKIE